MIQNDPQVFAQGGGYGPPPGGGYGAPPGGGYGAPPGGGYGAPPGGGYGAPPGGYGAPPPMAPPGGGMMPGGMPGGAQDPELKKSIDTWFIIGIVFLFLCCNCLTWILNGIGLYMLSQAKTAYGQGNIPGAKDKFGTGKVLIIVGIVIGFLAVGISIAVNAAAIIDAM